LDGVLASRKNDLLGILNGIDTEEWNPKTDRYLRYPYSEKNLDKKLQNKKALLQQMKLPFDESVATIGMISRLTPQKGFELLPPVIDELMKLPLQIVVLGSGEPAHEEFLRAAATTYRDQFSTYVGYNNELAHLITGGADMFLMPSRYEPCGLNQMFSLNYGTVPIVRKTGGLADTVKDYHEYYQRGNGFSFSNFSGEALYLTVRRALDLFRDKKIWRSMMRRGMREDFSWSASAKRYIELYEKAKERHVLP
ncbi:MAG TPA: glycosyltransferase, partial [bacterium]